jgi:dTDP-4-dehydrorhamnose 3,5-epimerase
MIDNVERSDVLADSACDLIEGVIWKPLGKLHDCRGWLCELFRIDEPLTAIHPVMAYVSATKPGVVRGPHEHSDQTDCFAFIGPGNFGVFLWDNRATSSTFLARQRVIAGVDRPMLLVIPPGVVHAYQNVGTEIGYVINCPNRLYRGPGRLGPVDEIRHEEDRSSPFQLD